MTTSLSKLQSKRCTDCGELKPFTEYYAAKRNKYGVASVCKECTKFRSWKLHRERADGRVYTRADYDKLRKQADKDAQLLAEGKKRCRDCGEVKSVRDYYTLKYRSGKRKLDSYCMECKKARNRTIKKRKTPPRKPAKLKRPERMDDSINKLLHSKW
jgi:hypothetical protein